MIPIIRPLILSALLLTPVGALRADDDKSPLIAEFKARAGTMSAAAISDDGTLLFTGEDDGDVTLWNVKTHVNLHNYVGHTRQVFAAALLPDGKRGVTCGDDNLVIIWDLATGRRLHQISTGDSIPFTMACNPDGALAAVGCDDGAIAIFDLATGTRLTTLHRRSTVLILRFSPDAKVLAAGYADGHVTLWDTSDWSEKLTLPDAGASSVGALAFTPNSRLLVTGNQSGAGFIWNVADGAQVSSFAGYANPEATPSPPVAPVFPGSSITPQNRGAITYLCVSLDGAMIFGSIQDAPPRFWDLKTGRFLGTADWFGDTRFYIARYGFPFSSAMSTPDRKYITTLQDNVDQGDILAQVWPLTFTPNPPEQ